MTYTCVHASADGCTAYSREAAYAELQAENERLREYHDRMEKWNFPADVQQASYDRDRWKARAEAAEVENERLTALTETLAGKHPDAAEMLFRERKLNETLLDLKAENEDLRNELNYCQAEDECVSLRECRAENERLRDALRKMVEWLARKLDAAEEATR